MIYNIVLIESDEADASKFRTVLQESGITNPLTHYYTSAEAKSWLAKKPNTPHVVVLNLNMPSSLELLAEIKATDFPVIGLITPESIKQIPKSCRKQVVGFILKPLDCDSLVWSLGSFAEYWHMNFLQCSCSGF